ncbi:hypothetical protein BC938DRAFT_477594 [Jimgerdemannia flammicorona]|uniref:Uncharacterized protein n=1 Tax=Jimgerdemannia flammicorona TaxID=994334 RepID=A0A433P8V1_9FUNG|nr:hypothetical protein BC938DRAFT_477594 [Jimgerdemannia flammicorona]
MEHPSPNTPSASERPVDNHKPSRTLASPHRAPEKETTPPPPVRPRSSSVATMLTDMDGVEAAASAVDVPQAARLRDLLRATRMRTGGSDVVNSMFSDYRDRMTATKNPQAPVPADADTDVDTTAAAAAQPIASTWNGQWFGELKTLPTLNFNQALSDSSAAAAAVGVGAGEGLTDSLMLVLLRATVMTYSFCILTSLLGAFISYATTSPSSTTVLVEGATKIVNTASYLQYDFTSWTSFYLASVFFWIYSLIYLLTGQDSIGDSLYKSNQVSTVIGGAQLVLRSLLPLLTSSSRTVLSTAHQDTVTPTTLVATLQIPITHVLIHHTPLLVLPVIILLSAIHAAYVRESHRKQSLLQDEHAAAQKTFDRAITDYTERRSVFMTTVGQELQDATHMAIATLEQFSPVGLLGKNQELLSACSIPVPTASISALNTTMKHIRHLSSSLPALAKLLFVAEPGVRQIGTPDINSLNAKNEVRVEFDIGELVQNVGDAMAGTAAKLGVELVVFHLENALHYLNIVADEGGFRHTLTNVSIG